MLDVDLLVEGETEAVPVGAADPGDIDAVWDRLVETVLHVILALGVTTGERVSDAVVGVKVRLTVVRVRLCVSVGTDCVRVSVQVLVWNWVAVGLRLRRVAVSVHVLEPLPSIVRVDGVRVSPLGVALRGEGVLVPSLWV